MNGYISKNLTFDLREELFRAETDFFFDDDDSRVPCVSFDIVDNRKSVCMMFKRNGVRYFLSDEFGYSAYRNRIIKIDDISTYSWQLSKIEFIRVRKWMLESLVYCSNEYKELCLDVINKFDYEKGRQNAHFQVIFDDSRTEIEKIRFNYRYIYYDLMMDNDVMYRGNVDDPFSNLNKKEVKGLEKKLVLSIMNNSKTIKNKIREIEK